ncbi:uncharacterized protein LOC143036817 [Oratosquilla oratoria]|uniref:uncharacterized protein LOC143036817 n=1 Tax=Oratosquilla oratoria TaxID=337810 RepID=UPI003F7679CF
MPKILSDNQRQFHKECCTDILDMIVANSGFLNKVVTCDKSWVFTNDPDSKCPSAQWKLMSSPRPKKRKMSRSQEKAMVIPFFNFKGLIHVERVPEGQSINREKMRKNSLQHWCSGEWWFHQDNAPSHGSTLVTKWMASRGMSVTTPTLQP